MAKDVKPSSLGGTLPPKPITKEEFGRRLYKLMSAKGWRQAELARRAGIGRDSVSNYVAGKSFPTALNLEKLAKALGADADEILPNHAASAILSERPDFEIKVNQGDPTRAWVSLNREVLFTTATKIGDLLALDNAANSR